jgi:cytidylate kinase
MTGIREAVMTEMQRFAYHPGEGVMRGNDIGEYVRFIDAEAAIVQARSESREGGFYSGMEYGYQHGQRDMLAKCIAAVEFLHDHNPDQASAFWYAINELRALQTP